MSEMRHERPGVYSVYDASSVTSAGRAAKRIGVAALAVKGTANTAVTLTGCGAGVEVFGEDGADTPGMSTLLKLLFANGASTVYAVRVGAGGGLEAYQAAFAALDIVNICSAYGKKAAIIGGRKALAAAEPQIRKAVEGSGIEITGTFWYGGEASRENMDMLRPQVADADMIFAVGGGKAIDTCKVLAHETNRPFFTFPTIASTCASCTSLGIVYHPDGSLREYSFSKIPPNHIFINTEIIANAPARYLWAGMGDTMAKHYECTISSRNDVPAHSDAMGIALSSMCAAPILRWGKQAMA